MVDVDTKPPHPTGKPTPWHAPHLDQPRRAVTLHLPEPVVQAILDAREKHLDVLEGHSRIIGWMASGAPLERDWRG